MSDAVHVVNRFSEEHIWGSRCNQQHSHKSSKVWAFFNFSRPGKSNKSNKFVESIWISWWKCFSQMCSYSWLSHPDIVGQSFCQQTMLTDSIGHYVVGCRCHLKWQCHETKCSFVTKVSVLLFSSDGFGLEIFVACIKRICNWTLAVRYL